MPRQNAILARFCRNFGFAAGECRSGFPIGEQFHLDRYLDEQMFRFNNRATKDTQAVIFYRRACRENHWSFSNAG